MAPIVSVIIPVFNVDRYIEDAVRSALSQTFRDIEVIAVNDGSTDESGVILNRLQREFEGSPTPLIIVHQDNLGQGASRNAGLRLAKGVYIAFLDGDDRWQPDKIKNHVKTLELHLDFDLTYCWFRVVDETGRPVSVVRNPRRSFDFEDIVRGKMTYTGFSNLVGRRAAIERIGGLDETLSSSCDLDFCLRMSMLRPKNIGCVPYVLVDYRLHQRQITGRNWERDARNWETIMETARRFNPVVSVRALSKGRARRCCYWASVAYKDENYRAARKLLLEAWTNSKSAMLTNPLAFRQTVQYFTLSLLPKKLHIQVNKCARDVKVFCRRLFGSA